MGTSSNLSEGAENASSAFSVTERPPAVACRLHALVSCFIFLFHSNSSFGSFFFYFFTLCADDISFNDPKTQRQIKT